MIESTMNLALKTAFICTHAISSSLKTQLLLNENITLLSITNIYEKIVIPS
jgi:hypothetical protein